MASLDPNGVDSAEILTPSSAEQICRDVQLMIDINTRHLERLRTPITSSLGEKTSGDNEFQYYLAIYTKKSLKYRKKLGIFLPLFQFLR